MGSCEYNSIIKTCANYKSAVMAILSLVLYYACPNTPNHVTAATVLAKMYSNSVLAIFNSRIRIIGGREDTEIGPNALLTLHPATRRSSGTNKVVSNISGSDIGAIRVQEDIYVHADDIPLKVQVKYHSNGTVASLIMSETGPIYR